ncbi:hypothetical protein PP175_25795 (plasmid) [Aneurinibacillus sp. Ricciae_BoGa-3]|uniref:hypothetical protein n=1 Tax=Aneurinibacillus sp. Ricciae_BoGa-3 TaxID=3022697 RepID=UPI00233FE374|nr:hypothetical protein [Aneurinibacillus sp. Ricciae_BoGa-3]WCK57482.1 hypothetical protein PP175_25795 [Aneurinibacillus sp. Ricciae_BoGa-3]
MDFGDFYFSANEQLRLADLLPVGERYYKSFPKSTWKAEYQSLSFNEWKRLLNENGYDTNRIKYNKNLNSIRNLFYVGDYFTQDIGTVDPTWLLNEIGIKRLKADEQAKKAFEKKDYSLIFFPEWNMFAIDYFIKLYKEIDKVQLYEVFKEVYTLSNYGFSMFPEEILEEVFLHAPTQDAIKILKRLNITDKDGYITVYRGEGKRSTPVEEAYSWTLSKSIATKFAHHFGVGNVYQAKVKLEKIIDYDNERNEEEILVRYRDIEEVTIV